MAPIRQYLSKARDLAVTTFSVLPLGALHGPAVDATVDLYVCQDLAIVEETKINLFGDVWRRPRCCCSSCGAARP